MRQIKTISDLLVAQKEEPDVVQEYLRRVSVVPDMERYLRWVKQGGEPIEGTFRLAGGQGRSSGIHPSSASKKGVCPLLLYYECTGEVTKKPKWDFRMETTYDIGTMLHCMIQQILNDMYGDQFCDEVSLTHDELHIVSHTDGIFDFTDYRFLLEIKSIKEGGNWGFERVQAKPLVDHPRQGTFYMACSDVPFLLILYINKNGSLYKEHAQVFNPELWQELKDVITPVVDAAYNGGPMVTGHVGSHCKRCPYAHGCAEVK